MFRVGNMELHQSLVARVPDGHPGLREVHAKWHRRGDEPRLAQRKFETTTGAAQVRETARGHGTLAERMPAEKAPG